MMAAAPILTPSPSTGVRPLRRVAPGRELSVNTLIHQGQSYAASEPLFAVRMRTVCGVLDIADMRARLRPTRFETYAEAYDVFQNLAMDLCEQGTLERTELWIEDVSTGERFDIHHPEFHLLARAKAKQ